jgi:hypothetical protein
MKETSTTYQHIERQAVLIAAVGKRRARVQIESCKVLSMI